MSRSLMTRRSFFCQEPTRFRDISTFWYIKNFFLLKKKLASDRSEGIENSDSAEMALPAMWQPPTHAAGGGWRDGPGEPALWHAAAATGAPRPNRGDAPVAQAVVPDAPPAGRKRQLLAVSCMACRRSKKQCSEGLPCSRCLRLGIEDECQAPARMRGARGPRVGQQPGEGDPRTGQPGAAARPVALPKQPVAARTCAIRFPEYAACTHAGLSAPWRQRVRASPKCAWALPAMCRLVDYGFSGEYLLDSVFLPLPVDVNEGLKTAFLAVGVASLMSSRTPVLQVLQSAVLQIAPAGHSSTQDEDESWELMDTLYQNSRNAVMRMAINPQDGSRTRTSFNPAFSALLLKPPEELTARLTTCHLESPVTEFEALALVCALVASSRESCISRYLRIRPVPRRISFVRLTVLRSFDALGRNCRIEHHMTQVSIEEMDKVLATAPDQVLIFGMDLEAHRPLTASSLVQSCDYDRQEGQISRMAQTDCGRARLRELAQNVTDRLHRTIEATRQFLAKNMQGNSALDQGNPLCLAMKPLNWGCRNIVMDAGGTVTGSLQAHQAQARADVGAPRNMVPPNIMMNAGGTASVPGFLEADQARASENVGAPRNMDDWLSPAEAAGFPGADLPWVSDDENVKRSTSPWRRSPSTRSCRRLPSADANADRSDVTNRCSLSRTPTPLLRPARPCPRTTPGTIKEPTTRPTTMMATTPTPGQSACTATTKTTILSSTPG